MRISRVDIAVAIIFDTFAETYARPSDIIQRIVVIAATAGVGGTNLLGISTKPRVWLRETIVFFFFHSCYSSKIFCGFDGRKSREFGPVAATSIVF